MSRAKDRLTITIALAFPLGVAALTPHAIAQEPEKSATVVLAGIDVYGSHKIRRKEVLEGVRLRIGESTELMALAERAHELETRIRSHFQLAFVAVSTVMDPDRKAYVTIDLVDRGDESRMSFAAAPTGAVPDPDGLVAAWRAYEKKAEALALAGKLDMSHPTCRALHCALGFGHPDLAPLEARFVAGVPRRFTELGKVLVGDRIGENRATAAFLLAYGRDREDVARALAPAVRDRDSLVRNNALRVLWQVQSGADRLLVPIDPVLAALRFPGSTDRNKALLLLVAMVAKNPAVPRDQVVREAGDVLADMVGMSWPGVRVPAIEILKSLSGEDHGADAAAWRAWLDRAAHRSRRRAR